MGINSSTENISLLKSNFMTSSFSEEENEPFKKEILTFFQSEAEKKSMIEYGFCNILGMCHSISQKKANVY